MKNPTQTAGPHLVCLAIAFILTLMGAEAFAERYRFQWSPRLSLSEQYDDNVYLTADNKEHDWITFLTPGVTFSLIGEEHEANLTYNFSLAQYARNDDRSTVRHYLRLSGFQGIPIAKRLTLSLDDVFQASEDPLGREDDFPTPSLRRDRERYYRNVFDGRINWLLGPEDLVYVGFAHILLINEDPGSEDSQEFRPSTGLTYWFTVRYGFSLDYSYGNAKFDAGDDSPTRMDDYQNHLGITTLRYRINPRTATDLSYSYDKLDYEGPRVGYDTHQATLGLSHDFSGRTSASLSGGYFIVVPEEGDSRGEPTGSVLITHTTLRSTFTLDGAAGYRRQSFEAENLGLSFFGRASVTFTYQVLERLSTDITGAYFRDEYQERRPEMLPKRVDTNWRGIAALNYTILRWLSGGLRYEYIQRLSNLEVNEYVDNRVTLTFTASHLSKPRPF